MPELVIKRSAAVRHSSPIDARTLGRAIGNNLVGGDGGRRQSGL